MSCFKKIVVLYGGQSGEREVSIHSAGPVIEVLNRYYPTQAICLDDNQLPPGLNPSTDVIFPVMHGDFGEDGQLQALLEQQGFVYVGSDSAASSLCMHKLQSKQLARQKGLPVLPGVGVMPGQKLSRTDLEKTLNSTAFVLKPENKGSSLGVQICPNFDALQSAWSSVRQGLWMIEPYVHGREITVGILQGQALAVGEICPQQGFYDYHNKYTAGACVYHFPADLSDQVTQIIQNIGVEFFKAAHCRDFGRADFVLDANNQPWFLEMNTIPGMTDESLIPQSAAAVGISFDALIQRIVEPAIAQLKA